MVSSILRGWGPTAAGSRWPPSTVGRAKQFECSDLQRRCGFIRVKSTGPSWADGGREHRPYDHEEHESKAKGTASAAPRGISSLSSFPTKGVLTGGRFFFGSVHVTAPLKAACFFQNGSLQLLKKRAPFGKEVCLSLGCLERHPSSRGFKFGLPRKAQEPTTAFFLERPTCQKQRVLLVQPTIECALWPRRPDMCFLHTWKSHQDAVQTYFARDT